MKEMHVRSLDWEDPLEKGMQPIPVFLTGESHGQRRLPGYSPWGRKDSDVIERLNNNDSRKKISRQSMNSDMIIEQDRRTEQDKGSK